MNFITWKRRRTRLPTSLIKILSIPQDNQAYRFPVSVKGVIFRGPQVILLKNDRDEWELPGGKLESGETPQDCVKREIEEELGLVVDPGPILDSWVYHIYEGVDVLIVTYGCYPRPFSKIVLSPEHTEVGCFTLEEVKNLKMPEGYKKSIQTWAGFLTRT
ncbi:MAG TPA: NUDIX domain-containing protein [Candidatus Limnocylindrales bacterium]|nr:NUDIX domain-containing protein [Candidatus Limnocylindrales bacterium]